MKITPGEVQRTYRLRFSESDRRVKAAVWRVLVEHFFQRWVQDGDTVLDLGCGYGEFLNHLRCGRRIGLDLNPDSEAALAAGVEFHPGTITDLAFLPEGTIDVVFASNVLEHLPDKRDLEQALHEVLRVLRPGGQLIVMGPNVRLLPGAFWDFWDHQLPLTDRSLVQILQTLGFGVIECRPHFLPYTTRSPLPKASWLVRLYLGAPPVWRLLGRQFLVRAARPASS